MQWPFSANSSLLFKGEPIIWICMYNFVRKLNILKTCSFSVFGIYKLLHKAYPQMCPYVWGTTNMHTLLQIGPPEKLLITWADCWTTDWASMTCNDTSHEKSSVSTLYRSSTSLHAIKHNQLLFGNRDFATPPAFGSSLQGTYSSQVYLLGDSYILGEECSSDVQVLTFCALKVKACTVGLQSSY
jgi:hypothetical protein